MRLFQVYINELKVFEGGSALDCWKWLLVTYGNMTVKELIDDGVEIR